MLLHSLFFAAWDIPVHQYHFQSCQHIYSLCFVVSAIAAIGANSTFMLRILIGLYIMIYFLIVFPCTLFQRHHIDLTWICLIPKEREYF